MNELLEKIDKANAAIAKFNTEVAKLKKEAENEGDQTFDKNDPQWGKVEDIERRIQDLCALVAGNQSEFDKTRTDWEGLSGEYETLLSQLDEVITWGDPDAPEIHKLTVEIDRLAGPEEQLYVDASSKLREAQRWIEPIWKEFERQQPASIDYGERLKPFEDRLAKTRNSHFGTDLINKGFVQIDLTAETIKTYVASRDYVAALEGLGFNEEELKLVESEIERLTQAEAETGADFEAVQARLKETRDNYQFDELLNRIEDAEGEVPTIQNAIDDADFTPANGQIASMNYELDAIAAQAEVLAAEKAAKAAETEKLRQEWDRCAPNYGALQKKVDDLKVWGDAAALDLSEKAKIIGESARKEEYADACKLLSDAEAAIEAPYSAYQKQLQAQKTYDAEQPKLETRHQDAFNSQYADADVKGRLNNVDGLLNEMLKLSKDKDYVTAIERVAPLKADLDKIEATLRELETRAAVAAEMGADPNTSSQDLDREVDRRLFEQEYPELEKRVKAVAEGGIGGGDVDVSMTKLDNAISAIGKDRDKGDFTAALKGVRDAVDEVNMAEEALRKQAALREQFEIAIAEVMKRIEAGKKSMFRTAVDSAKALDAELETAETRYQNHEYKDALDRAKAASEQLDHIEAQARELATQSAAAQSELQALQPRLNKVAASKLDVLRPAGEEIGSKTASVEDMIREESFADAIEAMKTLTKLLDDFEQEAASAEGRQRYLDALDDLDIPDRFSKMTSQAYPEIEEPNLAVADAHAEMEKIAAKGDWEKADDAASEVHKKLQTYKEALAEVQTAETKYKTASNALMEEFTSAVPKEMADNPKMRELLQKLEGTTIDMEQAAVDHRFHKAMELLGEARTQLTAVRGQLRNQFREDEPARQATNKHITSTAIQSVTWLQTGVISAAAEFRIYVSRQLPKLEVDTSKLKFLAGVLDFAAAATALFKGAELVGLLITAVKVEVDMGVMGLEQAASDRKKFVEEAANNAEEDILVFAKKLRTNFNSRFAEDLQNSHSDLWVQLADLIYVKKLPQDADQLLYANGLPSLDSEMAMGDYVLDTMKKQLDDAIKKALAD